jgi:hypothetical protein
VSGDEIARGAEAAELLHTVVSVTTASRFVGPKL